MTLVPACGVSLTWESTSCDSVTPLCRGRFHLVTYSDYLL